MFDTLPQDDRKRLLANIGLAPHEGTTLMLTFENSAKLVDRGEIISRALESYHLCCSTPLNGGEFYNTLAIDSLTPKQAEMILKTPTFHEMRQQHGIKTARILAA